MLALVSANLGGLDPFHSLPTLPGVLSTYYTDRDVAPNDLLGWTRVERVERVAAVGGPRLAGKLYKCQIHRTPYAADAEWFLWVDGCVRLHSLDWVLPQILSLGGNGRRGVFVPHPDRPTIAAEYEYVISALRRGNPYLTSRYTVEAMESERDFFAKRHNLSRLPTWCGGLWILPASPEVERFLDAWWWTVRNMNIFDQCAISPLLVEHGIEAVPLKRSIYGCEYWTRVPHA